MRDVRFRSNRLAELETADDPRYSEGIIKAYRLRLLTIRSAVDARDFYALKSLHFERLQGNRSHQHSMRLNKQFRLILEFTGEGPTKAVDVVDIEDYH